MKYRFMMYDWDECKFFTIPKDNIVDAIYYAWNYEFDVYEIETEELIFSGHESNETNSEMLEPYGVRLIDGDKHRHLQDIETGEIYNAYWEKEY